MSINGEADEVNTAETTVWIHEWIESKSGDWGRSGRTRCEKCSGEGQTQILPLVRKKGGRRKDCYRAEGW